MAKKAVTLYLDEETIDELKERNYNISFLCNETMKVYVSEEFSDIELSAKLAAIDMAINDIKVTVTQKQLEYDAAVRNYDMLCNRREQMKADFEESQNTLRVARLIRDLNKSIIALEFDITAIREVCASIIMKIKQLSPHFNLESHVKRFEAVIKG
jgi:uncharacterized coiled-coil protein SlyX